MGNNPVGHFFMSDAQSIGDFLSGAGSTVGAVFRGVTGGGWDFSQAGRDFTNYGYDVKNAFVNRAQRELATPSAAQMAIKNLNRAIDPNAAWNKVNWQSVGNTIRNAHYGTQTGVGNVTPPSQVMAISDPMTKMNIATSRGAARASVNLMGAMMDKAVAPSLIGAQTASDDINAAGGQGVQHSGEVGDNQFNTNTNINATK